MTSYNYKIHLIASYV